MDSRFNSPTLQPQCSFEVFTHILPKSYSSYSFVNMGADQSRPSNAAINEKLVERLQALHMKDERSTSEKDGFIVVGGEARKFSSVVGIILVQV